MIYIDPRRGSKELYPFLSRKVQCEIDDQLPAGDFLWEGYIPEGRGFVAVERKRIGDLIDCMCDGRFSGYQLIEMVQNFKCNYLIVEGLWRPNKDTGFLEVWSYKDREWQTMRKGSRAFKYGDVVHHLMTLCNMTSINYYRTMSIEETAQLLADMYSWHNDKPWESHTSHLRIHQAPKPGDRVSLRKPPLRRVIACDLPGVGWEKSKNVELYFPNTLEMIQAPASVWQEIAGIGKGIASKIFNLVRSE